jgi:hypothetical protein
MRRTIAQIRKELDSMRHDPAVVALFLLLPFVQIYAWSTSPSLVPYGLTVVRPGSGPNTALATLRGRYSRGSQL